MNRKSLIAMVLAGVAVLAVILYTAFGGSGDAPQSDPAVTPGQSTGVSHQDSTPTPTDDTQQSAAQSGEYDDTNIYLPEGATDDPARTGDDTRSIGIPLKSPLSDADAVAAARQARDFVTAAWNIQPSDKSAWSAYVGAAKDYGTSDYAARVAASDPQDGTAGWWGEWQPLQYAGFQTFANVFFTYPTNPTKVTSTTSYDVDVLYYAGATNTSMNGYQPMFDMIPVTLHMEKQDSTWRVSGVTPTQGAWIGDYLERPAKGQ